MKYILILILYILNISCGHSQSLLNTDFNWNKPTGVVLCNTTNNKIYLKTEINPKFKNISKEEFHINVKEAVSQMALPSSSKGIIKLYLVFEDNKPVYIDRIGTKGMKCTENQILILSLVIEKFGAYKLGLTKNKIQNSYGIIYLYIQNGQLIKARNVNFDFEYNSD